MILTQLSAKNSIQQSGSFSIETLIFLFVSAAQSLFLLLIFFFFTLQTSAL